MKSKVSIFLILILFAALVGTAFWIWNKNSFSKEVLKLEIVAPENANAGEVVQYIVKIKNNGDVNLEEPRLVFEFPNYSVPKNGQPLRVVKDKSAFGGVIYPGQEKSFEFQAQLFGQTGEAREAEALLSYRPKNLSAKYISKTSAITVIKKVPLSFDFDLFSQIDAGRKFSFSVNYFSSLDYPLKDLSIKVFYPPGFKFIESDPQGITNDEWHIPVLNKADGGKVTITGSLAGQPGEDKVFRAQLGIWIGNDFVVLREISKSVRIVEPSLYIDQLINGQRDYIAKPGDFLHYEITFRNIGDKIFQNLFLAIKLRGELFDLSSLKTDTGEMATGDNSIIWTGDKVPELKFLEPGSEGKIEFWINLKKDDKKVQMPTIEDEILLGNSRRKFLVKVGTEVKLSQAAFIDDEIFGSEGPLPPKVGQDNNFTIMWKVNNSFNPLKDVKIKAVLPKNVGLTGKMEPQDLTFDPKTRELLWEIDKVAPHQGEDHPLTMAFQIKLNPSAYQKGQFVELVGPATLTGTDQWTGNAISATTSPITTQAFGDQGKVSQ